MFTSNFHEVLSRLSQDPRNRDLSFAVHCWCQELNISQEASSYIQGWMKGEGINDISSFQRDFISYLPSILQPSILQPSITKGFLGDLIAKTRVEVIHYTPLIAFVITSVGLFYFYSRSTSSYSRPASSSKVPRTGIESTSVLPVEKWLLVLVVNARYESSMDDIRQPEHLLSKSECESLLRVTKAIWMGTEKEFSSRNLERYFIHENNVTLAVNPSEYDVYFLRIELNQRDPGFEPDVNRMDRFDAFQRLASNSRKVKVSPRLSSKSYESTIFYSK